MKTGFLPKALTLAAGVLLLQAAPAFSQTYHPHLLQWADGSGNIGTYLTVGYGWSESSNQPTGGTLGSWEGVADETGAYVTIHAGGPSGNVPVFSDLTINTLTSFSAQILSADNPSGPEGDWELSISLGSGTLTTTFSPSAVNTWETINLTDLSQIFTYSVGSVTGNWASFQVSLGSQTVTDILLTAPNTGGNLANFSLTSVEDTQVIVFAAVPEPGSVAMLLGGAGALLLMGRRRFSRNRA